MATITLTIPDDHTPVDLLLFRYFKREIPGLVEATLRRNPGLAAMGVFPPVGTKVLVDEPGPATRTPRALTTLWGDA